jgi:cell division protein FtsI/penicillin-binding protein 2
VTGGTAAGAFGGFPIPVAGKTGTAQQPTCDAKTDARIFGPGCGKFAHAWFICFAPVEDPTIAVAVLVERGGLLSNATGGQVAAPVARKVLEKYFELYPTAAGGRK